MNTPETVYDATEIQLKQLGEVLTDSLTLDDLASPEKVQLLLQRELVHLTEIKAFKGELAALRGANTSLIEERENLRIQLAKVGQREALSWIEIPISILSGFAINMLTSDFKNGLGWVLLLLSLLMLLFLRLPQIIAMVRKENQ
ncbi:MAG: hypothetical protein ABW208_18655 [Pyrinomonadaceae bacterium]